MKCVDLDCVKIDAYEESHQLPGHAPATEQEVTEVVYEIDGLASSFRDNESPAETYSKQYAALIDAPCPLPFNPQVVGSIPTGPTKLDLLLTSSAAKTFK